MDAFEQLISEVLWRNGYWARTSVKVELTKEEKRLIDRPSSPRWELDIVAYRGSTNSLHVIECKSFLDSLGVKLTDVMEPTSSGAKRYKLFHNEVLRETVFNRLARQFEDCNACAPKPKITLGLACGKLARESDRPTLKKHFDDKGWVLLDELWLRDQLKKNGKGGL
jgi:hypothetical protein